MPEYAHPHHAALHPWAVAALGAALWEQAKLAYDYSRMAQPGDRAQHKRSFRTCSTLHACAADSCATAANIISVSALVRPGHRGSLAGVRHHCRDCIASVLLSALADADLERRPCEWLPLGCIVHCSLAGHCGRTPPRSSFCFTSQRRFSCLSSRPCSSLIWSP